MTFKKNLIHVYGLVAISCIIALFPLLDITSNSDPTFLVYLLANTTGMLGIALLVWSLILGVRFIGKQLSGDLNGVLAFHKWLGKYGFIFIFVHPVLEMFAYLENWLWIFLPNFTTELDFHITLGRFALALYVLIWVTSAVLRSKLRYRPWLYIHYLSYPMVFLSLQHVEDIGNYTTNYTLLGALRIVTTLGLVIIVIARLLTWAGLFKYKYKVTNITSYGDDIFTIKLTPVKGFIEVLSGQYLYLQAARFQESHPYSVLHFDQDTGETTFGIKAVGPQSKKLRELNLGDTVYLDGAYGIFTRESKQKTPRVYYAGGIGITPFVDAILRSDGDNTSLLYSVKDSSCILYEEELRRVLGSDLRIFTTREKASAIHTCARISSDDCQSQLSKYGGTTEHYICGSKAFTESMVEVLHKLKVPASQIFTEEFSN